MKFNGTNKWVAALFSPAGKESCDEQIHSCQAKMLYGHIPAGIAAALPVAITLLLLLWQHAPRTELLLWFSALVTTSLIRLGIYAAYQHSTDKDKAPGRWMLFCSFGNFLGGLAWGCSIFLFDFNWPLPQQLFLILSLAGVTAGSIAAYACVYPALLAFHVPATLPAIVLFTGQPGIAHQSLGVIFTIYAMGLAVIGYIHHRTVVRSQELLRDNHRLLDQKNAVMEDLRDEKERIQVTLHAIADGVVTTNHDGKVLYLNTVAEQLTGWSSDEACGVQVEQVFRIEELNHGFDTVTDRRHTAEPSLANQISNLRLTRRDGSFFYINSKTSPIHTPEGVSLGTVTVFHDVTGQHQLAERLSYQAAHDALTGLLNRAEYERYIEEAMQHARRTGATHVVCYLDLDQFKVVNDSCGHVAGDELLSRLAKGVTTLLREGDVFARLGGDEFGFLLRDCTTDQAREFAERVRGYISDFRFVWEGRLFELGASIGLMEITADSDSLASILSAADIACYTAKDLGRNQVHVYQYSDEEVGRRHSEIRMVSEITHALEHNRMELHFQEIVPASPDTTYALRGEVIVRMRDSEGELLAPAQFLPAAKRYNQITSIDLWVVRNALAWFADVCKTNGSAQLPLLSINLSGASIGRKSFQNKIGTLVRDYQIDPSTICFEITETAAISDLESVLEFTTALSSIGVKFALDNFGSGLSSVAYLRNLPVDYLKIDGGLVRDVATDPVDREMVNSIHQLARVMGIQTIAESVENDRVLKQLREIGVDYLQGFAIARPKRLAEVCPMDGDVAVSGESYQL